jgi:hypothetical protein
MRITFRYLALYLILLIALSQAAEAQDRQKSWDPHRTWVFMVGLLEWKDSESFESFPKEGRHDEILLSVLKKRGVPAGQIVYLQDRVATTARIKSEFFKLLGRTHPGDTVFVYYEGHGYKTDDGKTYLASYDVDDGRNPGWSVASVPAAIERYFNGDKAIIALNSCYSGAMVNAVKSGKRRVAYAVMASSLANQASAGNWTFTEAIISAFRGSAVTDDNKDGVVTFAELEANAEADMLFGEEQVASFAFTGGFDPDLKIANTIPGSSRRIGERVEAYSENHWGRGYIADSKYGQYLIHYYGYEQIGDKWVAPKMIRMPKATSIFRLGERVEVEYEKKWYPAHIVNVNGGSHFVSFDNYDTNENEWVPVKRIRKIK